MSWLDDLRERLAKEKALTPERVVEIIAAEYGGDRLYIPRRVKPEVMPGDTPATLQARHGISRSAAYSWVRTWRR